jgi:hypothetical protein
VKAQHWFLTSPRKTTTSNLYSRVMALPYRCLISLSLAGNNMSADRYAIYLAAEQFRSMMEPTKAPTAIIHFERFALHHMTLGCEDISPCCVRSNHAQRQYMSSLSSLQANEPPREIKKCPFPYQSPSRCYLAEVGDCAHTERSLD